MVREVIIHNTKTDKIILVVFPQQQKRQEKLLNYGTKKYQTSEKWADSIEVTIWDRYIFDCKCD